MNVAIAAARLGAPAAFVGAVSTDQFGELIWNHLTFNDVDIRACQRVDAPTARAIVEHVPQLVFRFEGDNTADTQLVEPDLSVLDPGPHILHGGTLGLFRGRTAESLANLVESHDGLVSLDPNIRPQIISDRAGWQHFHDRWLPHTSIYKGSDEDLAWIWPEHSSEAAAAALVDQGVNVVIVTRGADGISVFTRRGETRVPAPSVTVVDTVGAGDTIVAAVLTSLSERGVADRDSLDTLDAPGWFDIGRRAVEAAAITCSRPGADPPYRHELDW